MPGRPRQLSLYCADDIICLSLVPTLLSACLLPPPPLTHTHTNTTKSLVPTLSNACLHPPPNTNTRIWAKSACSLPVVTLSSPQHWTQCWSCDNANLHLPLTFRSAPDLRHTTNADCAGSLPHQATLPIHTPSPHTHTPVQHKRHWFCLQVARRHFLSSTALDAMLELRRQFAQLLSEAHLIPQQQQQQQRQHSSGGPDSGSSRSSSKWCCWADEPTHPCNRLAVHKCLPYRFFLLRISWVSPLHVVMLPHM
jgi:hypothetical protein